MSALYPKDADLDRAAAAASFGAFFHQGQICMSTERILVDESVSESLAEKLAEHARALRVALDQCPIVGSGLPDLIGALPRLANACRRIGISVLI